MNTTRVKSLSLDRSEDDNNVLEKKHYNNTTAISKMGISRTRYPDGDNNNYYYALENEDYENESYVENGEECEEGTDVCRHKKERFQLSRSLLEEDAYPENVLTADEAKKCLSRIGQVGNGLSYAFIQIDVDHRNLTNVEEIANFRNLSIINVSHNHLDLNALDVLRALEYMVFIQADHNAVKSLCLSPMPYLQVLTLNSNRISSLSGLKQPSLERLELNDNKIDYLFQKPSKNFDGNYCNEIDCPNLSILALSKNGFTSIEQFMGVSIKLRILYLNYNKIDNLNGISNLQNLSHLNLRGNYILNLDGFTNSLNLLSYLNLRENHLKDTNEIIKLTCLKSLKTLILSYNDFNDNPITLRPKVLKMLPWLKRIDKKSVSVSEVKAAASNINESGQASGEELYEDE